MTTWRESMIRLNAILGGMMRKVLLFGCLSLLLSMTATVCSSAFASSNTALPVPVSGVPTVYSSTTVSDFVNACKNSQEGCNDVIGEALMDKMQFDGKSHICLASVSYGDPVPKWLMAHPSTLTMATEDGIYEALKALYPC